MDFTDFYDGASLLFMILILMAVSVVPTSLGLLLILCLILGEGLMLSQKNIFDSNRTKEFEL